MNIEPIVAIRNVIRDYMELPDSQIYIYNQNRKTPKTDGLFVVLQFLSSNVYANNKEYIEPDQEIQTINSVETITINILSGDHQARLRKEEIVFALNSYIAQQSQQDNCYRIAKIPNSFVNISEAEAGKMLDRFSIEIELFTWYTQTKSIAYYDDFSNGQTIITES